MAGVNCFESPFLARTFVDSAIFLSLLKLYTCTSHESIT